MRVDQQGRALGIVRQIKPARHLPVRARQGQIALALQRDRALAEKRPDAVLRGAHLGERRLGAVGRHQAAALQQCPRRQELGIDPRCRVVHRLSPHLCIGRFNPAAAPSGNPELNRSCKVSASSSEQSRRWLLCHSVRLWLGPFGARATTCRLSATSLPSALPCRCRTGDWCRGTARRPAHRSACRSSASSRCPTCNDRARMHR